MGRRTTQKTSRTPAARQGCLSPHGSEPGGDTHLVRVLGVSGLLRVVGPPDRRIRLIAEAQRGRLARRQLLAVGITDDMILSRLRSEGLIPAHNGVYVVAHL